MKKLSILLCMLSAMKCFSQTKQPAADSVVYLLHKFAQAIGKETAHITRSGNNLNYDIDFRFVDRGSAVPLKARLSVTNNFEPLSLWLKGSTSRFSYINDSIVVNGQQASVKVDDSVFNAPVTAAQFPVGGYSPGTVQMALLKYWTSHGKPATISLLPSGEITIKKDGQDTLTFKGQRLLLQRYVIGGLVWGNEIVWTDAKGELVGLITNDAEGDKLEMMLEKYEALLPELIGRAARYGMRIFAAAMKPVVPKKNNLLAIVGGTLIDVENNTSITNSVILIEDGKIKATGTTEQIRIPEDAEVIHAENKSVVPGLWDMHAHFQQAEWGPAYLASGVTTVRDCGNEFAYINAIKKVIDARQGVGPTILRAGIIDGPGPFGLGVIRASTPAEAIQAVQLYKKNGFDQIKVYSSITPAILKIITKEAHRVGLTVTGHIPQQMNIMQGIDSGMDQVNHIQYVYSAMKRNTDLSIDINDSANQKILDYIKLHNIVIDPTIGVFEIVFRSLDDDIKKIEPNFYSLPVQLQALYINAGSEPENAKRYKPMMESFYTIIKAMHEKGITFVAGTDMGFPGYSVARELEVYVMAGLSPYDALRTATIIPARVMKRDNISGSIQAGKQADLFIVDGNPLQNISALRNVVTVIQKGKLYDPAEMRKLAGFAK